MGGGGKMDTEMCQEKLLEEGCLENMVHGKVIPFLA